MTRVVLDTNVYISALMFGGLPGALLDLAFLRAFTLIISPALLDELDEKLRAKFEMSPEDAAFLRAKLQNVAQVGSNAIRLPSCRSSNALRNFRDLQHGVHLRASPLQLPFLLQLPHKLPQILMRHSCLPVFPLRRIIRRKL
jgi:putative PIN family toxin of toxin-antitoxin system